ncbi:glycosyltransferase family 4 protein [Frondihabitans australicus]|uniref:Glycosyltransferase involved in cell wall biosynthesis n=1 Tax=Frondihabitans australicus TaxID=386892 RepID=A0A495IJQ9_9MICO|nr:glycosyltransferase family 4 protein [Frondihabitans australicus]RKR75648.1 glycosyltransferase involved in cell wall biosynthesis [Frondihabitans australicus]
MKVAVLNNMAPFVHGGAEELALNLVGALERHGHDVELIRLPFRWEPFQVLAKQMSMATTMRVDAADRVIALKFPAYLVPHRDKTLWLLHQYRQAYDLYDAGYTNLPDTDEGRAALDLIRRKDSTAFEGARRIFTNSPTTSARLAQYNGFDSEVLYPPLNDAHLFHDAGDEGYLFAGGRVNSLKRQDLLIRALALTPKSVRLVIAGPADDEASADALRRLAVELGVEDRLTLDLRFTTREELAHRVNHARACIYIPYDEDSLGYVSMEAAQASKPVITTSDSGGILGLVGDGYSGWVAEPTAESLAAAMAEASESSLLCRERGANIHRHWNAHGATWDLTVERLLA